MLGFPNSERTIVNDFGSNYLKTVILQIKFPENKNVFGKKDEYLDKFLKVFPRVTDAKQNELKFTFGKDQTPILQPISSSQNGMEFRSTDGQKVLSILKDGINFTINGSAYKNFDNVFAELKLVYELLDVLDVKDVNRIAIRKINIIDFEIPVSFVETTSIDVMKMILNDSLISNISYLPSLEYINQSIQNILYRKDAITLNLKYGVIQPKPLEKKGQVILDIDLFDEHLTKKANIHEMFCSINKEIFNVFVWALAPDAIDQLKNK